MKYAIKLPIPVLKPAIETNRNAINTLYEPMFFHPFGNFYIYVLAKANKIFTYISKSYSSILVNIYTGIPDKIFIPNTENYHKITPNWYHKTNLEIYRILIPVQM